MRVVPAPLRPRAAQRLAAGVRLPARPTSPSRRRPYVKPGHRGASWPSRASVSSSPRRTPSRAARRSARPPATPSAVRRDPAALRRADAGLPAADPAHDLPAVLGRRRREVAVMARNNAHRPCRSGRRTHGYPGRLRLPRVPPRTASRGLHYWRVTGAERRPRRQGAVRPGAAARARSRARRPFRRAGEPSCARVPRRAAASAGSSCAAYDTELFGHWWFEGVDWLGDGAGAAGGERERRALHRRRLPASASARRRARAAGELVGRRRATTSPG